MAEGLIPDAFSNYLAVFAMLSVGILVEQYYIGRVAVFQNTTALLLHAEQLSTTGLFVSLYVLLGIPVGIGSLIAYGVDITLPDGFYQFTFFAYSSATAALVILFTGIASPTIIWLSMGFALGAVLNAKILTLAPDRIAPVEQFTYPLKLTDALFGRRWRRQ